MQEPEHSKISTVVGKRIQSIRRSSGISQQDLSDLAQMHPTTLSKLERGIGNPKLDTLSRIAVALDTTVAELVADITPEIVQPRRARRITAKDLIAARLEQAAELERELEEGA